MLLELNFPVKSLEGKALSEEPVSKILASALYFGQTQNPLRMRAIAQKLFDVGSAEIDKQDANLLKAFTEENKQFANVLKAEILDAIEAARLAEKEGEKK